MTARIGCRDLVVRAGERTLLSVPELDVAAGETLAVLGPNGAGKSTLVRSLTMLTGRSSGTLLLDGAPASRKDMRSAVASVLQRPVLRRGSVAANAASGLRLRGIRRSVAHRAATPWLERLGVAALARRDARSLSGGETQRVALARALAVGPRVLILDEPFAGLDATTRTDLIADLQALLGELGAATLLVTHDQDEAAALADRTALLIDGRLRQIGPTPTVLSGPADVACARLVGYTNVITDPVDSATLVARPEHAIPLIDPTNAPAGSLVIAGRLRRVVPLGGVTRLDVLTDTGELTCLAAGVAVDSVTDRPPGATLHVAIPRDRACRVGCSSRAPNPPVDHR